MTSNLASRVTKDSPLVTRTANLKGIIKWLLEEPELKFQVLTQPSEAEAFRSAVGSSWPLISRTVINAGSKTKPATQLATLSCDPADDGECLQAVRSFLRTMILALPEYGREINQVARFLFTTAGITLLRDPGIRTQLTFGTTQSCMKWIISDFGISDFPHTQPHLNSFEKVRLSWARTTNFHAKEELYFNVKYSTFKDFTPMPRDKVNANVTNFDPRDPETIWNFTASHPPQRTLLPPSDAFAMRSVARSRTTPHDQYLLVIRRGVRPLISYCGELPKGRYAKWGSFRAPFYHARIDRLFDRDYVWAVTQTMVSFESLALWAMHNASAYKDYPDFWE